MLTIQNLSDRAFASYTDFIRTSEPRHYAAVDAFWAKLVESGAVYKGSHSGWYSVSDECFYTETQIEKGPNGTMIATESGSEVVWQEEENWKFRLSMFAGHLRKWLGNPECE
jgi:methionyl-tRNA synthetase